MTIEVANSLRAVKFRGTFGGSSMKTTALTRRSTLGALWASAYSCVFGGQIDTRAHAAPEPRKSNPEAAMR